MAKKEPERLTVCCGARYKPKLRSYECSVCRQLVGEGDLVERVRHNRALGLSLLHARRRPTGKFCVVDHRSGSDVPNWVATVSTTWADGEVRIHFSAYQTIKLMDRVISLVRGALGERVEPNNYSRRTHADGRKKSPKKKRARRMRA